MTAALETLRQYLAFPFVQNALLAGLLIALAAALLGVTLVLRRLSYIGDGLSHVAFGMMAVAGALNFADRLSLSLPVTAVCALGLLRSGRGARVRGDAMLAMLFDVLSVTGGVPKYLEEIKPSRSAEENIARLCFRPSGTLFRDFDQIFADVFGERAATKRAILHALAAGPRTGQELSAALQVGRNGDLSSHLDELELAGFVAKDSGLNPETGRVARQDRYRLRDNYTRFYLRYIEPRTAEIKAGLVQAAPLETLPGWDAVLGLQFENLVLNQMTELLPLVGLGGLPVLSAAPWRTRGKGKGTGIQIDLLVQTRKSVCVVEIKRRRRIGEEVEAEVARKVRALHVRPGVSVRTALVYEGELAPVVRGNGYFDAIVPASRLLGLD